MIASATVTAFGANMDDESQLIAKCCRGDAHAWNILFDTHYAATHRFVYQLSYRFSLEDVEEICQETFLAVVRNIAKFQGQSRFQTWLFRIAANKARDHHQKQHALKRGSQQTILSLNEESPDHDRSIDPPSQESGPDGNLIRREDFSLLSDALASLGNPCQEIIELRYFGDLSYQELAETLALNPKTVSSRLSKCLDKLEIAAKSLSQREKKSATSV